MEQVVRTSKQKYSNLPTQPFSAWVAEGKHLIFFFWPYHRKRQQLNKQTDSMHYTPTKYLTDYTGTP